MSWQETHRYYDALRTAVTDLDRTDGVLVWRPEVAAVFGTPHRLRLALRSYWETMVEAQVEFVWDADGRPADAARSLAAAHPGLVRALTRPIEDPRTDRDEPELVGAA